MLGARRNRTKSLTLVTAVALVAALGSTTASDSIVLSIGSESIGPGGIATVGQA